MPQFTFRDFGTFAGPQDKTGDYNYDEASREGFWYNDIPSDTSFKSSDLGAYLYHMESDYVGFHCDGTSTAMMTLEASYGNIPNFNVFAERTNINGDLFVTGDVEVAGEIKLFGNITHAGNYNGINVVTEINLAKTLPAKPFDIQHPSKEGHRLRHVCLEGPEIGVYFRGKLQGTTQIECPEYWADLVDFETVTVSLTPIGCYQELFVDKISWNRYITVKNASGGPVNCHYIVHAERKDLEKLIPEYEGKTPKDYPGQDFIGVNK